MGIFFIGLFTGGAAGLIIAILAVSNRIADLEETVNTLTMLRKRRNKFIVEQMETNLDLKNNLRLVVNSLPTKTKRSYHLDTDNF